MSEKERKIRKNKKKLRRSVAISIKILLILIIVLGFNHVNSSFSNKISLLAVSENEDGEVLGGSSIDLSLKTRAGTGNIYVNLNTIEEIDTQISIINSQKIACNIFELDCDKYDFFYEFKGSALVLKGPSASSAIAILAAKTLNHEKIDDKTVITGSLNSGGIIGNVGGVETKIQVAENLGFDKVLIPVFSEYNSSKDQKREIEVFSVMDIVEAYNHFNGDNFELRKKEVDKSEYDKLMKTLGEMMCQRSTVLKDEINFESVGVNSSFEKYKVQAEKSMNSSNEVKLLENYYSMGSFCYNSNINYRILNELLKNDSFDETQNKIEALEQEILEKYVLINSNEYKENIKTINDFYAYLIVSDRIEEAKNFLDDAKKIGDENKKVEQIIKEMINQSKTLSNESSDENGSIFDANETLSFEDEEKVRLQELEDKNIYYSYAIERLYTVNLWENFISHSGENVKFTDEMIGESCLKINREINIKRELLNNYNINFFNEIIEEQEKYSRSSANKYICIYKGLETMGRINTVLNSIGITQDNQNEYVGKMLDFTKTRLTINSDSGFPIIPQIYSEYSEDLLNSNDTSSSMLYANYALSYADLNLYLEKDNFVPQGYFNLLLNELFHNYLFLFAVLVLLAFV